MYGIAVGGRCLYDAEVAGAHQAELQRARNWGGREGERVHIGAHLTQFFLGADAKLLLLVNDEQAKIVELYRLSNELVRAYDDVYLALLQFLQNLVGLACAACTAEILNAHGHVAQTLAEGAEVLIGQHGGGHKHSHLLVVGTRLEGGSHRHFGLAKAHIATHQSVHRPLALHVLLDVLCGLQLVGGVFINERGFQLVLHEALRAEGKSFLLAAFAIKQNQVACNVLYLLLGAFLHALPRAGAQRAYAGLFALVPLVFGHLVEGVDANKDDVVVVIDELDDLLHLVAVGDAYQPAKASNAMIHVNDIVAQLKLLYFLQRERHTSAVGFLALEVVLVEAVKYLMVGEETGLQVIVHITGMKGALHGGESDSCLLVLENLTQAFGLLLAVGQDI